MGDVAVAQSEESHGYHCGWIGDVAMHHIEQLPELAERKQLVVRPPRGLCLCDGGRTQQAIDTTTSMLVWVLQW
jgi:hypothetical protein